MIQKRGFQNNMINKILITGSSGFIGTNLMDFLHNKGFYPHDWDIKNGKDIFNSNFEQAVEWSDIVIHLAALTSVQESFKKKKEYKLVNVKGTQRVVDLCKKYKRKLIYISSAAVYDEKSSPYAKTKEEAENIVLGSMNDIPAVILRLFNVYGPHMNPKSGSIFQRFAQDNPITVYGAGLQTRDFIHVEDVCKIIYEAFKPKFNNEIVDVGTGKETTVNTIANMFKTERNVEIKYKKKRKEVQESIANILMLRLLYVYKFRTDIKEFIKTLC